MQFYSNDNGFGSYIIIYISLEQVQGMIENEREATTPSFAIDYMSAKFAQIQIGESMQNTSRQRQHYGRVCSIQTIKLNSSTNKSGWCDNLLSVNACSP